MLVDLKNTNLLHALFVVKKEECVLDLGLLRDVTLERIEVWKECDQTAIYIW